MKKFIAYLITFILGFIVGWYFGSPLPSGCNDIFLHGYDSTESQIIACKTTMEEYLNG